VEGVGVGVCDASGEFVLGLLGLVTGAVAVGSLAAAGGEVSAGGATAGGSPVAAPTEGAGVGGSTVVGELGPLSTGAGGFAGGEKVGRPAPEPYQSSNPGATTPMDGISSGPGTSWKSMAAVELGVLRTSSVPRALAVGSTVVWEMARREAVVSARAAAPSTEGARENRRC
jgi:hypothetical protein